MNHLAPLTIQLIRDLSQARRERDLAIELLTNSVRSIGVLERKLADVRERYYQLLDRRAAA